MALSHVKKGLNPCSVLRSTSTGPGREWKVGISELLSSCILPHLMDALFSSFTHSCTAESLWWSSPVTGMVGVGSEALQLTQQWVWRWLGS